METERITVEPSRLCRACGVERLHVFPLFARDHDDGLRLDDMLMACTDLKIHVDDGLPSSICDSCADELKTSYRFKQRCETTDRHFNEIRLKSYEIKQEQETVVFKEGENENLLELKEEIDMTDNSSSLSFKEVTEGISETVVISRETKQEQDDLQTITKTIVYKQEENFSAITEDEAICIGNLEDSPLNEDLRSVHFPNKKGNQNIIAKEAENEFPSGSKKQKEKKTIHDSSSEASSSNDDDPDYFPEELYKTNQFGRYECNVCGKSYSTNGNLQEHNEIHEFGGRKCFKCDVCGKLYTRSRYLREHKRAHKDGERKRFKCVICGKSFARSRYLWKHKRRHENRGRKLFDCDVCEKSFSEIKYLRQHKKTHKNNILSEQK